MFLLLLRFSVFMSPSGWLAGQAQPTANSWKKSPVLNSGEIKGKKMERQNKKTEIMVAGELRKLTEGGVLCGAVSLMESNLPLIRRRVTALQCVERKD